jgi:hypothetical protein
MAQGSQTDGKLTFRPDPDCQNGNSQRKNRVLGLITRITVF